MGASACRLDSLGPRRFCKRAGGRRQAASGRRQVAGGKRQAAGGRRQAASGKRQAMSDELKAAYGQPYEGGTDWLWLWHRLRLRLSRHWHRHWLRLQAPSSKLQHPQASPRWSLRAWSRSRSRSRPRPRSRLQPPASASLSHFLFLRLPLAGPPPHAMTAPHVARDHLVHVADASRILECSQATRQRAFQWLLRR